MPAGYYAPLPMQLPSQDADRELDEAFGSDEGDEEHTIEVPSQLGAPTSAHEPRKANPAVYDFERDFDYARPPPGSPPRPSAVALPNDFGNSNGLVPSSPVATPTHQPSFFRRVFGAMLPIHYTRLSTMSHSQAIGGGTQNDGVFANVTAKPSRLVPVRAGDGDVHVMPEETLSTAPPSYTSAQADAAPAYWETTVHAPAAIDVASGMVIDDLPSGSMSTFICNFFTSFLFQFVGFLLTYLLHTTHAAKFGSRAGLGLTLIQYGFYSRVGEGNLVGVSAETASEQDSLTETSMPPASTSPLELTSSNSTFPVATSGELLSFLLMMLGFFLLITSLFGFWHVKHWESSIRASQARGPLTAEEIEQDNAIRRMLENVFHLASLDDDNEPAQQDHEGVRRQLP